MEGGHRHDLAEGQQSMSSTIDKKRIDDHSNEGDQILMKGTTLAMIPRKLRHTTLHDGGGLFRLGTRDMRYLHLNLHL